MRNNNMMKDIDEAAIMWNKTKNPTYKDRWYKLVKDYFSYDKNSDDTYSPLRWNTRARKTRVQKTYGST